MGKRIFASLLAVAMIGGALTACNGDNSSSSSQGSSSGNNSSSVSVGGDNDEFGANFAGYPMNKSDQTISWWSTISFKPNAAYATADESPFHSILKEMLGVNIDWRFPTTGTDDTQAFNLMLAGDTLPDIITHDGIKTKAEQYIDEGTIRDLTPYMETYAPAYWKWIHSNDAYDRSVKTDSGKYYGFGFFREGGGWNDTYLGPVVNETWLEEANLKGDDIKTIADWDNMLEVFAKNHPEAIPLGFAKSRVQGTGLSGAFGAYSMIDFKTYVDDNNKMQLAQVQPEWRDYMAKINEWWNKDYLDHDFLADDDTAARSKAQNLSFGASITSMGQISNWERDANEYGTGAKWIALSYPTGNDGKLSMVFGGYYGIGSVAATISTSCPEDKIPLVMRCLDYAYTDEGFLYWNFGKQGNSWDYDDKGEVQYLPIVTEDPNGLNDAIDKFGGSTWSGCCIQATKLLYLKNTETAVACNDKWFYENEAVANKWVVPNGMTYTVDEANRRTELQGAMKTYVEETAVKYITGEESIDTFDSFVERVNGMGLDELLSIEQATLDRYLAR